MPYVVLCHNGHTMITDDEPVDRLGNIRSAVVCDNIGHALAVQDMVTNAYNIAKGHDAVSALTHECAVLRETIDTQKRTIDIQAHVIRDNFVRDEALENEVAAERTKTKDREIILKNVMGALALDMVLQRTHRERNKAMRHIVRIINTILSNVSDEMDDVPF